MDAVKHYALVMTKMLHPRRCASLLLVFLFLLGPAGGAVGAPASPSPISAWAALRALPSWLDPDSVSQLDVGIDVLVPPDVPAPFSGTPTITAYDGYYSLYWVVPGTPPTFLQITGEQGGTIPAYSKYDRNVQLKQNADINGIPAYHDLTPIYDLVYWQVGDVVYSVESQNLAETDSLSLASALVRLDLSELSAGGNSSDQGNGEQAVTISLPDSVASGDLVSIDIEGVTGATLAVDAGSFPDNGGQTIDGVGGGTVQWLAPTVSANRTAHFTLTIPDSGESFDAQITVLGKTLTTSGPEVTISCPETASSGQSSQIVLNGSGQVVVRAQAGSFPANETNTLFAPDMAAGRTISGSLPGDGGSYGLDWLAPEVSVETSVMFTVTSSVSGATTSCSLKIEPDAVSSKSAQTVPTQAPTEDTGQECERPGRRRNERRQ